MGPVSNNRGLTSLPCHTGGALADETPDAAQPSSLVQQPTVSLQQQQPLGLSSSLQQVQPLGVSSLQEPESASLPLQLVRLSLTM